MSMWTRPWLPRTQRRPRPSATSRAPAAFASALCARLNFTSGPSMGGGGRIGNDVQHPAIRGTEVRSHVAALLLAVDDFEGADLLEGRDEILVEVLADLFVGQGVHTERLGVVSGDARVFEVPGDVQDK